MSYYRYVCDSDRYDSVRLAQRLAVLDRLDGTPVRGDWRPLNASWDHAGEPADFPRLVSYVPVLSQRAWDMLRPLVGECVEALPLNHDEPHRGAYYVIHVLQIIEALDLNRSRIRRFSSGGIMMIDSYAFSDEAVRATPIFRLKEAPYLGVFVRDAFKETAERAGLTGAIFERVA